MAGAMPSPEYKQVPSADPFCRFLRTGEDDKDLKPWQLELAHKYYSKLFREYAIVDLSRFKEGLLGCRWRTHDEVISGRGQFTCGAKGCLEGTELCSNEVPFSYKEDGRNKQALVKVRLCPKHLRQLNHKSLERATKKRKKKKSDGSKHDENDDVSLKPGSEQEQSPSVSPRSSKKRKRDGPQENAATTAADDFLAQLLL